VVREWHSGFGVGLRRALPLRDSAGIAPDFPTRRTCRQGTPAGGGPSTERAASPRGRPRATLPLVPRRLDDLPATVTLEPDALLPPPRFRGVSFESFRPQHASQVSAKQAVMAAVASLHAPTAGGLAPYLKGIWRRARRRTRGPGRRAGGAAGAGLYLDGGFGVGKTHLLAAAFHASDVTPKRYLSFQELVYLIGAHGLRDATGRLGDARLYCIDEFELDDPGNTLIVKTFLAHVMERGALVITTSNAPPTAQGEGRFNASDFRREIQSIAERFAVVRVAGVDHRPALVGGALLPEAALPAPGHGVVEADWDELLVHLAKHHPSRYRAQLERVGTLAVRGVRPIRDQGDALRFVHFIDKAYDLEVPCAFAGAVRLTELFDAGYRDGAYAAKYQRCTSRLGELLHEAAPGGAGPALIPAVA
jgi:cell division protein ZapE